jgi:AraC-like DNA-binding protein
MMISTSAFRHIREEMPKTRSMPHSFCSPEECQIIRVVAPASQIFCQNLQLPTVNGKIWVTLEETVTHLGMIRSRTERAMICVMDTLDLQPFLIQAVLGGSHRESLESQF